MGGVSGGAEGRKWYNSILTKNIKTLKSDHVENRVHLFLILVFPNNQKIEIFQSYGQCRQERQCNVLFKKIKTLKSITVW